MWNLVDNYAEFLTNCAEWAVIGGYVMLRILDILGNCLLITALACLMAPVMVGMLPIYCGVLIGKWVLRCRR
jgi:hypothetical protein